MVESSGKAKVGIFKTKEMTFLVTCIFAIYAYFEGWREAMYFHYKARYVDSALNGYNEHLLFTAQRALVAVVTVGLTSRVDPPYVLSALTMAMVFSFIHNGSYYMWRNIYDPTMYGKGWMDQSTSTTAKISMTPPVRTALFIIGLCVAIIIDALVLSGTI